MSLPRLHFNMHSDRRTFLAQATRLLSLAALASAFPSKAAGRTSAYPFSLGVASGSPRPDSVILWTRILPDPLDARSSGQQPFSMRWEIAEDEAFRRIAAKGDAVANPVVISGDVHTFYAADIKAGFFRKASAGNPVIATEFCGTSVTSNSRPQSRTEQYVAQNPHIKYGRSDRRGYVMMEIKPGGAAIRFQALDNVRQAGSGVSTAARFAIENGRPGVVQTG